MGFFKVLKKRKILFINVFLLLYISINLFMGERGYTLGESIVFGVSAGVGFYLAIVCMAAIRFKLGSVSNAPDIKVSILYINILILLYNFILSMCFVF